MKLTSLVTMLIATGLLVPHAAIAATSNTINVSVNGGSVVTESHSSASSGGQTVTSGSSVSTGDSSASSRVETHMSSGSNGGTLQVKVESNEDGVTQTEEYAQDIVKGENIHVQIGTSSKSSNPQKPLPMHATSSTLERSNGSSTEKITQDVATTNATPDFYLKTLFSVKLPDIFRKVFSFFWMF